MKLVRLSAETDLSGFDCGDEDLNDFLVEDAKGFLDKRIATSFILEDDGRIVAYFCLLNDKISRQEVTNSQWKKIKDSFPDRKRFGSYPDSLSQPFTGGVISAAIFLIYSRVC